MDGAKVDSCSRMKDSDRRLAPGDYEVRSIWKDYFEGLYNLDTEKEEVVHMCIFDGVQRGNYFGRAD